MRQMHETHEDYKNRVAKEAMIQEVVEATTLLDLQVLLMQWIDEGSIKRYQPPYWDKNR